MQTFKELINIMLCFNNEYNIIVIIIWFISTMYSILTRRLLCIRCHRTAKLNLEQISFCTEDWCFAIFSTFSKIRCSEQRCRKNLPFGLSTHLWPRPTWNRRSLASPRFRQNCRCLSARLSYFPTFCQTRQWTSTTDWFGRTRREARCLHWRWLCIIPIK